MWVYKGLSRQQSRTHDDRRRGNAGCRSLRWDDDVCGWRATTSWLSQQMLVESDRGRRSDLETSLTSCDLVMPVSASTESLSRMTWSDAERRGDLETSLRISASAEQLDCTRGIGFTLGGVGSNPLNGSYNQHNNALSDRGCDYILASAGPTDRENHLLPYNMTSFTVPLFTIANGVVHLQKVRNMGLHLRNMGQ